ncbi:MAG: phospholipase D-like domain-containing protein, partial [Myxococcota bacterium]|nr:phospholipase D-like domain-containing protein [Myxococcota bacterium]
FRDGKDGVSGTSDDQDIDTLQALDDISWVGPVTFEQLVMAVRHRCDAPHEPDLEPSDGMSLEVVFSPQDDYWDSSLGKATELINAAEHSIDLAMYSFRDKGLLDEFEAAVERGVRVRAITEAARGDRSDPDGTVSARLEELGIDVRYVNKIMHHKFMIVDGRRGDTLTPDKAMLFTSSGNFSYSAGMRFDENTILIEGNADIAGQFQREFTLMWNNSRDFEYGDVPSFEPIAAVAEGDLPDDERFEMLFTSDNFDLKTTSYGPTFSVVQGRNTVSDRLVQLIEAADSSILVASGHLRSRPISEAILAKHAERPDMDIRVYLDGQEYVSNWYYYHLVDERNACIEEAGDSASKKQACTDKGFYYSYALYEAGIPVRFKHYAYRWHYTYAPQMHHKYLVIDGETVVTGSYNLSDNAEHNTLENMVVYDIEQLAESFTANFETMWVTGHDEGLYEELLEEITDGTGDIPLVYDAMALAWDEVKVLKDAIEDLCSAVHNWDYKKYPQSHQTCPRTQPE